MTDYAKVIAEAEAALASSGNGQAAPAPLAPILTRLQDVEPEDVRWLWPGRIPYGKTTAIEGDPGLGKSTVLFDLAARLSAGGTTPDGHPLTRAGTVILTAEDGLADTVRPRVEAAGGDVTRMVSVVAVRGEHGPQELEIIPAHLDAIRSAMAVVGARLVIIDPLVAFLPGSVNSWRDQDVRRALRPLATLAEETGAAVVFVRHLNKGNGPAIYRGGGSIGIVGAVRSALLVARDPEDESRRVLACVKSNLAPDPGSLAFYVEDDGHGRARIRWAGSSPHAANQLVSLPEEPEARSALEEAVDLLRETLAKGPRPVRDVERAARESGVELRTLRRARARLGVRSSPSGFGGPRILALPEPPVLTKEPSVLSVSPLSENRGNTGNTEARRVNTEAHPDAERVEYEDVTDRGEAAQSPPDPAFLAELRDLQDGMPDLSRQTILDRYPGREAAVSAALDQLDAEGA